MNLFCRWTRGRSLKGKRAVANLPNSKGPNIHIIGSISVNGTELLEIRRGSFNWQSANDYIQRLIENLIRDGIPRDRIALICDNAPAHSRFEVVGDEYGVKILRLGPYSPMLNPIENIWSQVKAAIKGFNGVPYTEGRGVIEQRLQYWETIIGDAIQCITAYACTMAINHSTCHHRRALAMESM